MLNFDWDEDLNEIWEPGADDESQFEFLPDNDPEDFEIQLAMADAIFSQIMRGMEICEGPDRLRSAIVVINDEVDPRNSVVLQPEETNEAIEFARYADP